MEPKFTEQQSLEVITGMIEQARNNFQKGSGTAMIFSGYLVAFIALVNAVLLLALPDPNQSFWIWLLMIPGWIVTMMIDRKIDKRSIVKTHVDKIMSTAWQGFGISTLIFMIVIFGIGLSMKSAKIFTLITPVMMIMAGLVEFITAKACRFKPFMYGAVVMWIGAVLCMLATAIVMRTTDGYYPGSAIIVAQFIIYPICMLLSFVVPGHMLNKKSKSHV